MGTVCIIISSYHHVGTHKLACIDKYSTCTLTYYFGIFDSSLWDIVDKDDVGKMATDCLNFPHLDENKLDSLRKNQND